MNYRYATQMPVKEIRRRVLNHEYVNEGLPEVKKVLEELSCDRTSLNALAAEVRSTLNAVWLATLRTAIPSSRMNPWRVLLKGSDFNDTDLRKGDWWLTANGDITDGNGLPIFGYRLYAGDAPLERRRILEDLETRLNRIKREVRWAYFKEDLAEIRKAVVTLAHVTLDRLTGKG